MSHILLWYWTWFMDHSWIISRKLWLPLFHRLQTELRWRFQMDFNLVIALRFYHQPWWWSCWNLMGTWGPWNGIPSGRWLGYLVGVPWLSCFAVKNCRALIRGHGHDAMATAIAGAWMFTSWDHIFTMKTYPLVMTLPVRHGKSPCF